MAGGGEFRFLLVKPTQPSHTVQHTHHDREPVRVHELDPPTAMEPDPDAERRQSGASVPLQLPDGFATAQVIAQSARATGAPRYKDGPCGDLWHGRINSEAAGLEVTVWLDMRLPIAVADRRQVHVPSVNTSYVHSVFHRKHVPGHNYNGAGRGAHPAAGPVSEEDRTRKLHCGRCTKELSAKANNKALNKGATYWICMVCYFELRAEEEQDEWECPRACPSAAAGRSDCLCWCEPKQAAQGRKRRKCGFLTAPPPSIPHPLIHRPRSIQHTHKHVPQEEAAAPQGADGGREG